MITNNNFANDTEEVRVARTSLLSHNIATHAPALGIVDPKLALCLSAADDYMAAITSAGLEEGEAQEAIETLNTALNAAFKYYVDGKDVLLAIIYSMSKPDDMIKEYGFIGSTPHNYEGLSIRLNKWIVTDAKLTALVPPDPRVAPPAMVAGLVTHLDTITDLWHTSQKEIREKSEAYAAKHELFDAHSALFSFVFTIAKFTFGEDSPLLRDLGCCPKSEIWTYNKPHAPKNLSFDEATGTFSWDPIDGVDSYQLACRLTTASGEWTNFYEGVEHSTTEKPSSAGEYDIRVRAIEGENLGNWSGSIVVNFG